MLAPFLPFWPWPKKIKTPGGNLDSSKMMMLGYDNPQEQREPFIYVPTICDLGEHTSADCWCHLFYYWHFFAPGMMGDYLTWHTRKKQFLKVWLNDDINLAMASKKSLDWKPYQNLTWKERCCQMAHLRPKVFLDGPLWNEKLCYK